MRSTKRLLLAIGLSGIFLALMLPGRAVRGQAQPQDLKINYVTSVADQVSQTHNVSATISVLDAGGKPVTGLPKDAIDVSLFGQPITDFDLPPSHDPMAIILVIDTSGSMNGKPLDQAKAAAKQLIDTLGDRDEVALYSFNSTVTNLTPGFTVDKGAIKNWIGSLAVPTDGTGWTCLYDALYDAVTLAVNRPQGRGAIVVLSDGADIKDGKQCSQHTVGEVVDKAQNNLMPIYTIGLGQADRDTLQKFADQTGGQALISPQPSNLAQSFEDISHLLKDQYLLVFKTGQSGSGALQISLKSDPKIAGVKQIVLIPPPVGPTVAIDDNYQVVANTVVFTISVTPGSTPAAISEARWHVNQEQGVISGTQVAYPMVDSAGACRLKPAPLDLRVVVTDEKGLKGEGFHTFPAITEGLCPKPVLPYLIGIAGVALALGGIFFFVIRKRKKVQPVVVPENLDDTTQDAASEVGLVARLRLMGGAQTADGQTELLMTTDTFRIGRSVDNNLRLEDMKVSRRHAEIHYSVPRKFTLFDHSTGGTRVNDKLIKASSEVLTNNAMIVVGNINIRFVMEDVTEDYDGTENETNGH